ncbi:hypothetical protein DPMN_014647 [Dreissena polymorpha]|uniref:Uncharacterized protein n=1 Tax=Dreissena polymorpha TaxID=45954 RepID=A0A9D4NC44_DREPO|nr:hypothetical protein DPMN_014647 [Dreissena polymorpha]
MVDAIQHKALRIALRALNCTPGALLEEEAGVLPLDLRRKQQSLNFWARAKPRHGSNPVNKLVGTGTFIKGKYLSVIMSPYLLVRVLGPWLRMPASTRYL